MLAMPQPRAISLMQLRYQLSSDDGMPQQREAEACRRREADGDSHATGLRRRLACSFKLLL